MVPTRPMYRATPIVDQLQAVAVPLILTGLRHTRLRLQRPHGEEEKDLLHSHRCQQAVVGQLRPSSDSSKALPRAPNRCSKARLHRLLPKRMPRRLQAQLIVLRWMKSPNQSLARFGRNRWVSAWLVFCLPIIAHSQAEQRATRLYKMLNRKIV